MNRKFSMSIIYCCMVCCLLWGNTAKAKNFDWAMITTDDMAEEVKVSQSGFIYTAGRQLKKYDGSGNVVWSRELANAGTGASDMVVKDGFIYVTGYFRDTAHFDPGNPAFTLIPNGSTSSTDVFVAKFDTMSNPVWVKSFGGNRDDQGIGLEVGAGGDVFATGTVITRTEFRIDLNPSNAPADTFFLNPIAHNANVTYVLKLNGSGVFQWAKTFNSTMHVLAKAIAVERNSGNIVLTGSFTGTADFDPSPAATSNIASNGSFDVFIVKLNPGGDLVWAKSIGGNAEDKVNDLVLDTLNNLYVTGGYKNTVDFDPGTGPGEVFMISANGTFGSDDMYLLKLSATGAFMYAKSIGSDFYTDEGFGLSLDNNGKIYIAGEFRGTDVDFDPGPGTFLLSTNVGQDPFILELTWGGDFVWAGSLRGGATYNFGRGIASDGNKNVYLLGTFNNTVDFDPGADTFNLTATNGIQGYLLKLTCDSKGYDTLVACDSISMNGTTFDTTGNYVQVLPNAAGCDSLVYLNITINHSVTNNISVTACESYTVDGSVYFEASGQYNVVLTSATGCDSVVVLDLTIGKWSDTVVLSHCGPYSYEGESYATSGMYTIDLGTTVSGCDSIKVLDLTIAQVPDVTVVRSGTTLIAQAPAADYQWITCPGNEAITGAAAQSFTPEANGSYAVVITKDGCSDTSICNEITGVTAIGSPDISKDLKLYPNPVTHTLALSSTYSRMMDRLIVFNIIGQQVMTLGDVKSHHAGIDVSGLTPGIYIVEIHFGDGTRVKLPFSKK